MGNKFVFNPLSGYLDLVNDGVASIPSVQSETDLPLTANDSTLTVVRDTDQVYVFNLGTGLWTTTGIAIDAVSGTSDPAAITAGFETDVRVIRPTLTLHPADATNPGLLTAVDQDVAGVKSFIDEVIVESGIDTPTGGTLDIGATNADAINLGGVATTITIGNTSATVIIQGTTEYQDVTNLNVEDKLITVNKGGSVTTGGLAGLEIEENNVITGYAKTSADRNSWTLKAPNTAGDVTLTPGASGITLDQSSHDPVTIGTANGLSISTQVLSLAPADATHPGAVTTGAQTLAGDKTFQDHIIADNNISAPGIYSPFNNAINLATGQLFDSSGVIKEDWAAGLLNDSAAVTKVDWAGGYLNDSSGNRSLDWQNRAAYDGAGSAQLTYNTGGVEFPQLTPTTVPYLDGNAALKSSAVTPTELGYVSGVTSPIQTQLTNKADRDAHDISLSSATLANNQASPASVTGLAFPNANVRSANVQYSVTIVTTGTSLFEEGTLKLVQRGSDWTVARSFDGDDTLVDFDVTNAGQVTYTSSTYTGFVSGTLKFRATDTTV